MNSNQTMVLDHSMASLKMTTDQILAKLEETIGTRTRYLLFVPPMGDLKHKVPLKDYERMIRALIDIAQNKKVTVAISTFPMVGPDPKSKLNATALPYNTVLRGVSKEKGVQLVDIASIMQDHVSKHPGTTLNMHDERFNYPGCTLMAESVYLAFGGDAGVLPALRKVWNNRASYTYKYTERVRFSVKLSADGENALQEISDRYHALSTDKILAFGIHHLLNGTSSKNQQRVTDAGTMWTSTDQGAKELALRNAPDSANEKVIFEAYAKTNGIDLNTVYQRAFLVGMYALRKEDPLGRGTY